MDVLKLLIIILIFTSCARVDYLTTQGVGQIKLLFGATEYQKALSSSDFSGSEKDKIRKIQNYKDFFYRFFELAPGKIYSKIYKLKNPAVSYLVIASKYNEIKAKNECFPIYGCFPYLGFFDKNDAIKHSDVLKKDDYHVWIRPVYAYSTLGTFNDPILSSFFYYNDYQLANLIFHELFHTIFFVDDQVDLNENMANFFADRLTEMYFSSDSHFEKNYKNYEKWVKSGLELVVKWSNGLNARYKALSSKARSDYEAVLEEYHKQIINPEIEKYCEMKIGNDCWAKRLEINNASLAAYMTYEKDSDKILKHYQKMGLSLKDFFTYIKDNYKIFL